MKLSHCFLILLLGSAAPGHGETPWWQEIGPVKEGDFRGGFTEEEGLSAEEKAVLSTRHFDEWTDYEDDYVKLRFPKHPLIKFHVSKKGEGIQVEGGVCTSVDNSFQQAYVLEVGKATYGLFLLQPAKWLDDGICFCGPMVHDSYSMRDGSLVRYSLLPGGAVKKAQVLGGGLRLMSFEWTHLACPREIYEGLVEGMRVKLPNEMGEKRLKEKLTQDYGWTAAAGWLHPGDSREKATELLGKPTREEKSEVEWVQPKDDYLMKIVATFQDGAFVSYKDEGINRAEKLPIKGTLSWVNHYTSEADRNKDEKETTPEPATEELVAALKSLKDQCYGYRWRDWCDDLTWLIENRNVSDSSLVDTVLQKSRGRRCELELLQAANYADLKEWVGKGVSDLAALDPEAGAKENKSDPTREDESWLSGDMQNLLEWQTEKDPENFLKSIGILLESRKAAWAEAMLASQEELTPALRTKVAAQFLEHAIARQDGSMVQSLFEKLDEMEFDDPAPVREQVLKLPEGPADSDWEAGRKKALETLEKKSGSKD